MTEPHSFGSDLVDKTSVPGDPILADHINNLRAWIKSIAALALIANTETLSENKVLVDAAAPVQFIDPSASEYSVELPAEGSSNHIFYFVNTSESHNLEIVDDGAVTIAVILPGLSSIVVSDGTNWHAVSTRVLDEDTLSSDSAEAIPTQQSVKAYIDAIQAALNLTKAEEDEVVHNTGNETVAGIKTFSSFPVTPSSAPTANYQTANKKYVDDNVGKSPTYLTSPLTSTSWDGDGRSSAGKTKIDLSAVFGVPAGVKAVLVRLIARDSGSSSFNAYFGLSPNSGSTQSLATFPAGKSNNNWSENSGWVPCDVNGDIYYQCAASGAGTLDVVLEIWGYQE